MTDRELLELAAKAAGLTILRSRLDDPMWKDILIDSRPAFPQTIGWNPLADDGDALRLSVKLQIDIKQYGDHVVAWFDGGFIGTGRLAYEGDPSAATRRAIVRAAAEIGKAMP